MTAGRGSGGRSRDAEAGQHGGGVHVAADQVDQGDQPLGAEGLVGLRVQLVADRVVHGQGQGQTVRDTGGFGQAGGRLPRDDRVDGWGGDTGAAGLGGVRVHLVVRMPRRAEREDGDLLHVGGQVVVPDRGGPLLQGLEDRRHAEGGGERADYLAAR